MVKRAKELKIEIHKINPEKFLKLNKMKEKKPEAKKVNSEKVGEKK
jgi:hypothetical protein